MSYKLSTPFQFRRCRRLHVQPPLAVTGCDQRPVWECAAGCPAESVLQSIRESERIRGKYLVKLARDLTRVFTPNGGEK